MYAWRDSVCALAHVYRRGARSSRQGRVIPAVPSLEASAEASSSRAAEERASQRAEFDGDVRPIRGAELEALRGGEVAARRQHTHSAPCALAPLNAQVR